MKGLIVDIETTGFSYNKGDRIWEIGLISFEFADPNLCGNRIVDAELIECYSGCGLPDCVLDEKRLKVMREVSKIDNPIGFLSGKKIDMEKVQEMIDEADIIIAHNIDFELRFFQPEGIGKGKLFGCSKSNIDWDMLGCEKRNLNYLSEKYAINNPMSHRTMGDCIVTFMLIKDKMNELYNNAVIKNRVY